MENWRLFEDNSAKKRRVGGEQTAPGLLAAPPRQITQPGIDSLGNVVVSVNIGQGRGKKNWFTKTICSKSLYLSKVWRNISHLVWSLQFRKLLNLLQQLCTISEQL